MESKQSPPIPPPPSSTQGKKTRWKRTKAWIGRIYSSIRVPDFTLVLAIVGLSMLAWQFLPVGNFLTEEAMVAIINSQEDDDADGCFDHVFKLKKAVERSYREDGMFRESVLQYTYRVNLPMPQSDWPDHIRVPMLRCGMKYGVQLANTGYLDGSTKVILIHVLLAKDRKNPKFWYVLKADRL